MTALTQHQIDAARDATGNGELDLAFIASCVSKHAGYDPEDMTEELDGLVERFDALGGRGVDLADRIDSLRIAIAVRRATAQHEAI